MAGIATVTKRVSDVEKELGELLIESEHFIAPEKRAEFAHQVELMLLNSSVRLIEMCSKVASARGANGADEVNRKWHHLRAKSETLQRRSQLFSSSTLPDFEATLMWMAEQGMEDDLSLIRQVRSSLPVRAENLDRLFDIAEQRISERVSGHVK